ncbi:hypothetical protein UNDKW_3583 [Undibacterium sp. KW1]|nr:hypothetical protein UNDKW_3583 [Undibacterium sp. KW1]
MNIKNMSTQVVLQYQYLWDGSQPGWELIYVYQAYVDLSLKFDLTGPSNLEMMAVRRTVHEFSSLPLAQVIARLRGSQTYSLGRFESRQARIITANCRKEGLIVLEKVTDTSRHLFANNQNKSTLVIDDAELAKQVHDTALLHGIRVRRVET